jgi:DNA-binding NarL/FixJ family response regulator
MGGKAMKVLLADDHALFREGVRMVLESLSDHPIQTLEASDFVQALAILRRESGIDIALVDLSMPGMDGFAALEAIRRIAPDIYLVVISGTEDPADIRRVLDSGAHGFIGKSSGSAAMMQGIRSVLAGETFISPAIALPPAAPLPVGENELDHLMTALTPRQRDVLAMLRLGKSNKEVARDLNLAEITVKLHVTAILRTLGCDNRTQAAIVAAKMGL